MVTMRAVVTNNPRGDYDWYTFLRYEPSGRKRGRHIGKLLGPGSASFNACQSQIKRASEQLRAKLLKIEYAMRELLPSGEMGRIIENEVIWSADLTQ